MLGLPTSSGGCGAFGLISRFPVRLLVTSAALAAGLAHLPRAEFRHALAFELAIAVVAATAIASARWIAGRGAAAPARDPR